MGEAMHKWGAGGIWKMSVPSCQFNINCDSSKQWRPFLKAKKIKKEKGRNLKPQNWVVMICVVWLFLTVFGI